MTSLCLNMIVKNEAHVIRRCLDSVRPLISSWCILDTGSSDGTQELIRDHLKDLPGSLHQSTWKGFGASRTEAIRLAAGQADYLLFMDADDELVVPEGYRLPPLVGDAFFLQHKLGGHTYQRLDIVSTRLDWRYVGVLHETLHTQQAFQAAYLEGPSVLVHPEGARSQDPQKYLKDAEVLEQGLQDEPGNTRYWFYLAQSYRDAGLPEKALAAYRSRATLGGWDEEVYVSLYWSARLLEVLDRPVGEVIEAYLRAYEARPQRAETLGSLARFLRERKQFHSALLFAEQGLALPKPDDLLFLEESFYTWRCLDEFAVAASWVGRHRECLEACDRLLREGHLPADQIERVRANREFSLKALG